MCKSDAIDLKLVHSGASNEYMAYQFKYDSIHGRYPGTVEATDDGLKIDGVLTPTSHTRDPAEIPFSAMGAEYIGESSLAGAEKMIFFAPAARCASTFSAVRNAPVDSQMYSAPMAEKGISAGSRVCDVGVSTPSILRPSSVASTVPG